MKNLFFFFALLLASAQSASAQTTSIVKTYIRAEETLRIGTVGSQAVSGFNTTIPSVATNDKLPTTKAVKDFVNASFVPLGGTAGGDLNGTWPIPTVDGLQGVAVSAVAPTTGQVLKYNGTAWAPGAESDPSTTNEIQTISISGQNLTLSNGGGTVAIPNNADGNGIFDGGSHTIPVGTVGKIDPSSYFVQQTYLSFDADTLQSSDGNGFAGLSTREGASGYNAWNGLTANGSNPGIVNRVEYTPSGEYGDITIFPGAVLLSTQDGQIGLSGSGFLISSGISMSILDNSTAKLGLRYADDYGATIAESPRSIPDVGTVKIIASKPIEQEDSDAVNGQIYYSKTVSKLCYKDPGGTIHELY